MTRILTRSLLLAVLTVASPGAASAQVLGTFAWQTQPYCNVVTVTVTQQGGVFQLTGSDNLCGTGSAPLTGTAVPGGPGVLLGMTVSRPDGRVASISASVSLASLSGAWTAPDGTSGSFSYNGAAAGSPRPDPGPLSSTRVLGAVVFSSGGIARGSGAVSATRLATGQYDVTFNRSVEQCVWVATAGDDTVSNWADRVVNVARRSGDPNALFVAVRRTIDPVGDIDSAFHVMVLCP